MAVPAFTKGLKQLRPSTDTGETPKPWKDMTPAEKVDVFKQTSLEEAAVEDLALISPFKAHRYYEDDN